MATGLVLSEQSLRASFLTPESHLQSSVFSELVDAWLQVLHLMNNRTLLNPKQLPSLILLELLAGKSSSQLGLLISPTGCRVGRQTLYLHPSVQPSLSLRCTQFSLDST